MELKENSPTTPPPPPSPTPNPFNGIESLYYAQPSLTLFPLNPFNGIERLSGERGLGVGE